MDADLQAALETLHDFRQFVINNATQWQLGAGSHHNPMWARVTETLDRHGMNTPPERTPTGYIHYDTAYYCLGTHSKI